MKEQSLDNLWLAQMLFDLGAVQFGNFTVSESAVSSPVFVNPKVLISNPSALRVASKLMQQEISLAQSLRRPKRSEEHTSELQSPDHLVCRLLLEKKKSAQQETHARRTAGRPSYGGSGPTINHTNAPPLVRHNTLL